MTGRPWSGALNRKILPGLRIFGGLAGDDGKFSETYVFSHTGYSADGAAVIVLDRSGWK